MKWLMLLTIRLYQRTISRILPPSCRFVPSCSEYGYEAIVRYGIVRGGVMAAWRVMRCNPWGGHGYDPVPDLVAGSGQRAVDSRQKQESRDQRSEDTRSPQAFNDFALTPHAPGRSLTEGVQ